MCMCYSSAADSIGAASMNVTQLALKAGVLCKITRSDSHNAVQRH